MAQVKPEFERLKEFDTYVATLVHKYPDVLDGLDPKEIVGFAVLNKDPKENKPLFEIRTVPFPVRLDVLYSYYVIVNMKDWESFDSKHQAALVFDVLCSLSKEGDGKVIPFDLKDHSVVLRTLGVDYMKRSDIPDIMTQQVDWKLS